MSPVPVRELPRGEVLRRVCNSADPDLPELCDPLSATAKFCPECAHPVAGATPSEARFASSQSYYETRLFPDRVIE